MKKKTFNWSMIGLLLGILLSCHQRQEINPEVPPLLLGCWTNAYEEESIATEKVYRPCDYTDFPVSRYRSTFILKENNQCEYLVLAPNDAHYMKEGIWELQNDSSIIHIKDENNVTVTKLEIITFEDKLLIVKI